MSGKRNPPTRAASQVASRRQEFLSNLDDAHREFVSAVEDLDEQTFDKKWLDNRWGVREIAAHITGWHGQFSGGLERLHRGEHVRSESTDWRDVDGLNETFASHAKGKRKAEVLLELDRAVDSFKSAAESLSDDQFDDEGIVAGMFRKAGYEHFGEHTEMVRDWLGSRQ
jgi:hypothetical protein